MTVNFETDQLIILYYFGGAGGNFISSCLALSQDANFSNATLINRFNSTQEKFEFFKAELEKNPPAPDFNMGISQLLEIPVFNICEDTDITELKEYYKLSPTLAKLSTGKQYFFLIAHYYKQLPILLKVWPNSRLLKIRNATKWIDYRYAHKIKTHLPLEQVSSEERAKQNFDDRYPVDPGYLDQMIEFDANSFFKKQVFLKEMARMYQELNLSDFDVEKIEILFDLYTTNIKKYST